MKAKLFSILVFQVFLVNTAFSQTTTQFKLEEATIDSVHEAMKNHQITCTQLINAYLTRIKKYNLSISNKAPINAFTEINPSVLNEAQHIDEIYAKTQKFIGPLHCIPVLLKDNIDSFDTTTTSGSFALLGNQPTKDAFLVSHLRKAGAIILGKGGMDEFAWGTSGISSRSGRIGNAYDSTKNPGGSSSGPAAGVSANFALIGIGTDNSCSIRVPAAFNGLVGLRPSTGLISQRGIFPMGNLDGTAGPLTRTTKDLAIVLDVIAQPDSADKQTINIPRIKNYTAFLKENGLQNKRIGIVHHVGNVDTFEKMPDAITDVLHISFQKMRQLGAITIDVDLPKFDNNRENNQAGEIQDVNEYLDSFPATRKNSHDICESNRTRTFGPPKKCLQFTNSVAKKYSNKYRLALAIFEKNKTYVQKIMNENHLDALLIPISTHGSATYDAHTMNSWRAPVSSNAGLPSIAINIGYSPLDNMPVGIELVGKQFDEGSLITIAYAYETHSSPRTIPSLPEPTESLLALAIPELNNLFTILGKSAYEKVLKNGKPKADLAKELTPEIFRQIAAEEISKFQHASE